MGSRYTSPTGLPVVASPGASVDSSAILQTALDTHRVIQLKPGETFLLQTAVFLDAASNSAKYAIYANGATIRLSASLPVPSTWDAGIGAARPTGFFNGTLRTALSGGTVDTSSAGGCTNAPSSSRFVIYDAIIESESALGAEATVAIFGGTASNNISGASSGLVNCVLNRLVAGISWSGYADGNYAEHVDVGANPAGSSTRIIYQRTSGDRTWLLGCGAYGGYICDLAGSNGFKIASPVSGQINIIASHGLIDTGHQETDELSSALPWSVNIDRSHVTILDHYTRAANIATKYSIKVNDAGTSPLYVASEVSIRGWRPIANYISTQGDAAKGPSLHIQALNTGGRVRVQDTRSIVIVSAVSVGWEGLWVTSADAAIQTALTAGADYIATGDWELSYSSGWAVGSVASSAPATRQLTTPTLAGAVSDITGGTLVNGTTYEYICATKTAAGGYSAMSSAVQVVAGAGGVNTLTITNTAGPVTMAVWRKAAAGVASAPTQYVEIASVAYQTIWVDSGVNINGRPWQTTSLPVPNTVASTGLRTLFPRRDPRGLGIVHTASVPIATPQPMPIANRGVYMRCDTGGTITSIAIDVGTQSGNICVAVFANSGVGRAAVPAARKATSGAVACPAPGYAEVSLGGSVVVDPGDWLFLSVDNTTATIYAMSSLSHTNAIVAGFSYYQDTAHPAPASATPLAGIIRQFMLVGV